MKTLKYILSIGMVLTLTTAYAVDFQSTSTMQMTTTSSAQVHSIGSTSVNYNMPVANISSVRPAYRIGQDSRGHVSLPMSSTASFRFSGTKLPMAAASGVVTAEEVNPARHLAGPRRVGGGDGLEDEDEPTNPADPSPVGDAMWLLIMLAIGYGAYYAARRRENTKKNNLWKSHKGKTL